MKYAAAALVIAFLSAEPGIAGPAKSQYQLLTERAWKAALNPKNATGGACWRKIGTPRALALVRYCAWFAETTGGVPCNSANECIDIAGSTWSWCRKYKWDPSVLQERAPNPNRLPCENTVQGAPEWRNISHMTGY
jgi:hypothetical protein